MASRPFDVTIIGGGIVGLATAMELAQRHPRLGLLVLEKEKEIALHQTGHNSGVIHSGIYYRPGSIKAETCVTGRKALIEFCDAEGIPYDLCGKVIVATSEEELPRLEELYRRGSANGVQGLEMIGPERLKEIEPHAYGIKALHAPSTGIIDFPRVAHAYAGRIRRRGGEIRTSQEVKKIMSADGGLVLETSSAEFRSKYLINCAGLFSDRVAKMVSGRSEGEPESDLRIIPFRGEYYMIVPERRSLVRGLIYPVADPRFPFLGVHFTRTIHGEVEAGPNAVLALAREGYQKTDFNIAHAWEVFLFGGFWAMAGKYWRTGFGEMHRSFSKPAFVKALQRLLPEIKAEDLVAGGTGVRAQAVSGTGALLDDFVIKESANAIHVLNAPSPGATSSIAIGRAIVEMATKSFSLNS
ncbi:MAG: L-2-hydroxyglutarate oxidase [Deltaproteobacteria bacterium]|nr:L-2-hydroxyglutarate oxidase [Deltaproteobacteria bacterium]